MDRLSIANKINYKGKATRTITVDSKLDLNIGDEYKFFKEVESWAGINCSENFIPEIEGGITYVFTCDDIEGHEVDYEDEEECEVLDCENCESEGEVLVKNDIEMKISFVSSDEDFKEMGYYEVELVRNKF